jgi:uncharacterized protein
MNRSKDDHNCIDGALCTKEIGGEMVIPYQKLQHETLVNLIKEFVMREGTDYAHQDYTIEQKIEAVLRQLKDGYARIVFDEEEQSFNIIVPEKRSR